MPAGACTDACCDRSITGRHAVSRATSGDPGNFTVWSVYDPRLRPWYRSLKDRFNGDTAAPPEEVSDPLCVPTYLSRPYRGCTVDHCSATARALLASVIEPASGARSTSSMRPARCVSSLQGRVYGCIFYRAGRRSSASQPLELSPRRVTRLRCLGCSAWTTRLHRFESPRTP